MFNKLLIPLTLIPLLSACVHMISNQERTNHSTSKEPTIMTLDGVAFTEQEIGNYTIWACTDSIDKKGILIRIGVLDDFEDLGFILYEGKSGVSTYYYRQGLNQRWDWDEEYSFILKPDRTGFYYDFTYVSDGETTKANSMYNCY